MSDQHRWAKRSKVLHQTLAKVDGAVTSTGAADGDSHVGPIFRFEVRYPAFEEPTQGFKHLLYQRFGLEKSFHLLIATRQWAKVRFPVGVW